MKNHSSTTRWVIACLCIVCTLQLNAQNLMVKSIISSLATIAEYQGNEDFILTSPVKNAVAPKKKLPNNVYRHHKKLSATYTGYAIEITKSKTPLARTNVLFEQFGSVYFDNLEGKGYSYCIIANFSSKKALQNYVDKVIKSRAPLAKVVEYKAGVRK